jgi:predicted DNA binding CopG/RHH family protein
MSKYNPKYLDPEEEELMEGIEKMDLKQIKRPTEEEQKALKDAARQHMQKETKMNIRIDPYELKKIKEQAEKEGLKYQTFIKSIIHKYITGQLVDRDKKAS